MSMTVVRSPIVAYDRTQPLEEDGWYDYTDQGIHRFAYTLVPHAGDWRDADTVKRAAELNQQPITVIETFHEGPLPQRDSYLSVESCTVLLEALKRAEDGNGWIVRCRESAGRAGETAVIRMLRWNRTIKAVFGAFEIKTFRVPEDPGLPVTETDFLERPIG